METSNELEQLRAEIDALAEHRNSRRYSPELRARVTSWARARVGEGKSVGKLSDELGMGEPTLNRFLGGKKAGAAKRNSGGFKRVKVTPMMPASGEHAVVRGPCGVTVEGLSIDALAKLLTRLSCSG